MKNNLVKKPHQTQSNNYINIKSDDTDDFELIVNDKRVISPEISLKIADFS